MSGAAEAKDGRRGLDFMEAVDVLRESARAAEDHTIGVRIRTVVPNRRFPRVVVRATVDLEGVDVAEAMQQIAAVAYLECVRAMHAEPNPKEEMRVSLFSDEMHRKFMDTGMHRIEHLPAALEAMWEKFLQSNEDVPLHSVHEIEAEVLFHTPPATLS